MSGNIWDHKWSIMTIFSVIICLNSCLMYFPSFQYTDEEVERCFEEFYEDVHTEFLKFGEIVNFKVLFYWLLMFVCLCFPKIGVVLIQDIFWVYLFSNAYQIFCFWQILVALVYCLKSLSLSLSLSQLIKKKKVVGIYMGHIMSTVNFQ